MRRRVAVGALFLCGACGAGGAGSDPAAFEQPGATAANAWLPLEPGTLSIYRGEADGQVLDEHVAVQPPVWLPGVGACLPVWQQRWLDGVLIEHTIEWLFADAVGNVWRAGEHSWELHGGALVRTADSWLAGETGLAPVLHLPAEPRAGEGFAIELPGGREQFVVTAVDAVAGVPAGTFAGCVELVENPGGGDQDIILYAPNVGLVEERWDGGHKQLVEQHRPR
jgi:hypothetical protein